MLHETDVPTPDEPPAPDTGGDGDDGGAGTGPE